MKSKNFRGSSLILVVLLVALVVFFVILLKVFNIDRSSTPEEEKTVTYDQQVKDLATLGNSDEISDIEDDLNNTNIDQIDQELPQVDKEASTI